MAISLYGAKEDKTVSPYHELSYWYQQSFGDISWLFKLLNVETHSVAQREQGFSEAVAPMHNEAAW